MKRARTCAGMAGRLSASLLAGALACAQAQSPARTLPDAREATTLRPAVAAKAERGAHECLVEPAMVANVGSPIDGVLEVVAVDRGDTVRKGQVVARLQSGVEAAAVDLSRARVEFGRRKMERNETLYQKQLISVQEKDEMETETRLREQELKKDVELLKLRTIVSPFDGVVVERRLVPGDLVRADKSVVLKLAQIDPLNVEVIAAADLFGSVKIGMAATVTFRPLLPGSFAAKVVVVDRLIDAASGTFGVRLRMSNPGNRIPAGIKCAVQFAAP